MTEKKVFASIHALMGDLSDIGISKAHYNRDQKFHFRSVDDVLNVLSPLLVKHRLLIMPRVINKSMTQMTSKSGAPRMHVSLTVEYDFVSVDDGSVYTARAEGEGMDSSDKATNKALSAAYKTLCIQALCIPTEGEPDADAEADTADAQPEQFITPAQAEQLRRALHFVDVTDEKFCQGAGIEHIEALQAHRFEGAMRNLRTKRERKLKAEGQAEASA